MFGQLREVKKVLDKHKIMFWPDCGTLLFMYRDNKLDAHDIDFSIYHKDSKKLLLAIDDFIKQGYAVHSVHCYNKKLTEVSLRKQGLAVDIFVRQGAGGYLVGVSKYEKYGFVAWGQPYHYFKFKKFSFDSKNYLVPEETEKYLAYYFGKDWQTPKPEWNSATDAPCINNKLLKKL